MHNHFFQFPKHEMMIGDEPFEQNVNPLIFKIYGSLTLFLCAITILGDILLILYFLQKTTGTSNKLYMTLIVTDFVIALSGLFISYDIISYSTMKVEITVGNIPDFLIYNQLPEKEPKIVRFVNSFVYGVGSRLSPMTNCITAVIRAYVIIRPFSQVNINLVISFAMAYCGVLSVVMGVAIIAGMIVCTDMYFVCEPTMNITNPTYATALFVGIPFAVPCIPVFLSCVIIVCHRFYHKSLSANNNMKKSTVTVMILSLVFLICNGSFVFYSLYYMEYVIGEINLLDIGLFYGLKTFSVFVNSSANCIILIARSSGIKVFVQRLRMGQVECQDFLGNANSRRRRLSRMSTFTLSEPRRKIEELNPVDLRRISESIENSRITTAISERWDRRMRNPRRKRNNNDDDSSPSNSRSNTDQNIETESVNFKNILADDSNVTDSSKSIKLSQQVENDSSSKSKTSHKNKVYESVDSSRLSKNIDHDGDSSKDGGSSEQNIVSDYGRWTPSYSCGCNENYPDNINIEHVCSDSRNMSTKC